MKRIIVVLIAVFVVVSPASACIGARQAAMGWSGVATSNDAMASYWNPAALPLAQDSIIYDNTIDRIIFAAKYDSYGFHYVNQPEMKHVNIGYGHHFSFGSIGVNIGLGEYYGYRTSYKSPNLDISYFYQTPHVSFGLLIQNVVNIRPSIAFHNRYLVVTAELYDILDMYDYYRHYRVGIEISPFSFLSLRAGYNELYDNISYGVGLRTSFAVIDMVYLDDKYYYSISLLY